MPVFRINVVDAPRQCWGVSDIVLLLQTKDGHAPGVPDGDAIVFEAPFEWRKDRSGARLPSGPIVHRESSDSRRFVYLAWLGVIDGEHKMFRRLKVYFDQAAPAGEDLEVSVQGRDKKGNPACARAIPI